MCRAPSPSRWLCRAGSCAASSWPPPSSGPPPPPPPPLREGGNAGPAVPPPAPRPPSRRRSLRGTSGVAPERRTFSVPRVLSVAAGRAVHLRPWDRAQHVVRLDVGPAVGVVGFDARQQGVRPHQIEPPLHFAGQLARPLVEDLAERELGVGELHLRFVAGDGGAPPHGVDVGKRFRRGS